MSIQKPFTRHSVRKQPKAPSRPFVDPETLEIAWPHADTLAELEALGLLDRARHSVDIRNRRSL